MAKNRYFSPLPTTPYILVHPALAAHYLLEGRTLICLVRHGQTDWNLVKRLQGRENIPLNDTGRAQAEELAGFLCTAKEKGVAFDRIFCSPLSRAHDTASTIANVLGLEQPQVVERLTERDYGSLAGLTFDERVKKFPGGEKQAGNVESVPRSASRMLRAVDEMVEMSHRRTAIAVSHGGIINAVFSRLTSGEIGTGKTLSVNCSASILAAGIGETIPLAYNLQSENIAVYLSKLIKHGAEI